VVKMLVIGWRTFPDLWLTCDYFVGKVSTIIIIIIIITKVMI